MQENFGSGNWERPELDKHFIPAVLWRGDFAATAEKTGKARPLAIVLERPNGTISRYDSVAFPDSPEYAAVNLRHVERLVKFLLWMKGGSRVTIAGAPEIAAGLSAIYSATGARAFDHAIMGQKIYNQDFEIRSCTYEQAPEAKEIQVKLGGNLDGCRIGFDLGGSDRKCAALIDGKVVFSEEIPWDPYFQKDPAYHLDGIRDSLRRAAEHLPRVDAIGGSAAGVYVDNAPRIASLFRGVSDSDFKAHVVNIFHKLCEEWGNIPFVVANDGDVTALAGAIAMETNGMLGVSMGTSQAVGYVNCQGNITDWLNELAFAPVDYRHDAPADEWSGDLGCGVQYFSQQAVARLAPAAGINFAAGTPFPEQLVRVQELMAADDPRAASIYRSIGVYFGYSIAHYADFYDIKNLLVLGRVASGRGGDLVISTAQETLEKNFPQLARDISFKTPDEKFKRHGQAVIAASLPQIR